MIFVTGNTDKFEEALRVIPSLTRVELDLPEIQSLDAAAVVKNKLLAALGNGYRDVVVEDTSLSLECLNGLPGTLVKFFIQSIGAYGLYELALKLGDQRAIATTTIGFSPERNSMHFVSGHTRGLLVAPRGSGGFGFDSVFQPEGSSKTYSEMTLDEKVAVSHRTRAFQELKKVAKV